MRSSCAAFMMLLAGLARAADAPKPNALTQEEIADGWISLFDGENFNPFSNRFPSTCRIRSLSHSADTEPRSDSRRIRIPFCRA